jgi:hypothetical protein
MVSRTLRTNLLLSLAFIASACGDDASRGDSTTFGDFGNDMSSETADTAEGMEAGDGDPTTSGDGDPTTSGDGDPTTSGDGDPTTSGDGDPTTGDGDPNGECIDLDKDGYGENCPLGPDACDDDWYNWTVDGCANCKDADGDGWWVDCDQYDENQPGPDCDDNDFNVFTPEGCANCVDNDGDGYWVGCDQYGPAKPGPDCNDNDPNVGLGDAVEICDGEAQNCAGEIDNMPADEMCPPDGVDAPNVAPVNGWDCDPPAPGEDGCKIKNCVEQYFDLDGDYTNGCECAGTPRTGSLAVCSNFVQGALGTVLEGHQLNNLIIGTVPLIDNGIGGGNEDWYWVEFPEPGNPGVRPNTGSIQVSFAINDGLDYRFQVFRGCNQTPYGGPYGSNNSQAMVRTWGAGAPPTREWWFFDNHTAAIDMPVPSLYKDNINWPNTVYIRVFRVQNDKTCNTYRLSIKREPN